MRIALLSALLACTTVSRGQDLAGDLTLHRLLIPGANWELVAENLGFADGPCSAPDGAFYFSDMKANAIYRIGVDGMKTKVADEPASGLKIAGQWLFACQGSTKRILAIDLSKPGTPAQVVATDVQPNDLVVTARRHIYFTETGKKQVSLVDASKDWSAGPLPVTAVDTGITAPNGLTLSPDQGTLAVSDYRGGHVWTFRIEADGSLTAKAPTMTLRLPIDPKGEFRFHEPPPVKKESAGDGMTSDAGGRFYVTSALGLQVFDPTGRMCGVLPSPQQTKALTSCTLAGPDRDYLYVTNSDRIYRRRVQARGNDFSEPPK